MMRPGILMNRDNDFRWVEWVFSRLPGEKIESSKLAYTMFHHSVNKAFEIGR